MPVIYLVHDVHGAKVAIDEQEAIYDEMNGWERYDPDTPDAADDDGFYEPVNEMTASKRRGRRRAMQEE